MPAERVSGIPFGLGFTKPHNYWEVVRTAWQNKRNPLFTWDEASGIADRRIRTAQPERIAVFITSRGMTNESYYVANKVARFLGTNHIDNSSRPCHSPSTTGLKDTIGVAASTCSYTDWI